MEIQVLRNFLRLQEKGILQMRQIVSLTPEGMILRKRAEDVIAMDVLKNLQRDYPNIHFHLYSGNAAEVTERLDKGLLDSGLLMQPADITKYDYFNLPEKDIWGVVMRRDSPLAEKETILCRDLEWLRNMREN